MQDIVEYIDVEGASCLGNRGINYVDDTRTKYRGGYYYIVRGSTESNLEEASTDGRSVFSKYFSYIYIAYFGLTMSLFFFHHFADFQ